MKCRYSSLPPLVCVLTVFSFGCDDPRKCYLDDDCPDDSYCYESAQLCVYREGQEPGKPGQCSDLEDNDWDGLVDCLDPDCGNSPDCSIAGDDDDDDDSDPDDDDSDPDDDDATVSLPIAAVGYQFQAWVEFGTVYLDYTITYWQDKSQQLPFCKQYMEGIGSASFGFVVVDCANCTGVLTLEEGTVVDESSDEPDGCDAAELAELDAADLNFGEALLTSVDEGGWGDFLTIGLIDAATMSMWGLDLSQNGSFTETAMTSELADLGFVFTHGGYLHNTPGTLASSTGLDAVAGNAGGNSSWYGYWQIYRDPAVNFFTGSDMEGAYLGAAIWQNQM